MSSHALQSAGRCAMICGLLIGAFACSEETPPDEPFALSAAGLDNVTWVRCASEGGTCSFNGTRRVRYGTETTNVIKSFTASTRCTNDVFGDPVVGTTKACWYEDTTCAPSPTQTTWVKCAEEHQICNFTGTRRVRYGTESANSIKTLTATTRCENSVFGDPAVGIHKTCWYEETTPGSCTTPTPPPTSPPPTTPPSSTLKAVIQATRVAGVAPLAVMFDSTGTTAPAAIDPFRQLTYSYNFGDERGQTWAVSGKPKNTEVGGPIAAHVFDVAGTFTVKVRAADASGAYSEATVTITVQDPNAAYAAAKTVCVSKSNNFTGCPAGAAQQSALPSGTAWSGKRVLLHRGESFGEISILDGNAGVQVGGYGTGAKPIVARVGVGNWRPQTTAFASDITVMDLDVSNGVQQQIGNRVLFYRNDVHAAPGSSQIMLSMGQIDYWYRGDSTRVVPQSAFYNAREIFFVENSAIGDPVNAAHGFWGDGSRSALMGNKLGSYQQHSARFSALHKGFIAHNELRGISADGMRLSLKLHSMGVLPYGDGFINDVTGRGGWASRHIVIANNLFGNAANNNSWTLAVAPQNDTVGEGLEDIMIENNRFVHGPNTSTDVVYLGRRITARGNTLVGGGNVIFGTEGNTELPASWNGPNYIQ